MYARRTLLPEVGLSLLTGGHNHVASSTSRQAVEPGLDTLDGHDVQVLGAGVVGAVHDRSHWQSQGHAELVPGGTSASTLTHLQQMHGQTPGGQAAELPRLSYTDESSMTSYAATQVQSTSVYS
jgi:hypothetical protein